MKKSTLSFLLALLLLFSACGGKASDSNTSWDNSAAWDSDGWNSSADMMEKPENNPEMDSPTQGTETENFSENDLANRKLIKTLYLTMETTEFNRLKSMLEELIPAYGGYIQDSDFYDPQREGRHRSYNLTVRIPADNLNIFHDKVGLLGTITNESEKMDDVTTTYVDLQAYKESLDVEYAKVLELLEKADNLDHVLVLESKLSELRYQINSYESKLRTYDNLISYSTVHINIREVTIATVTDDSILNRISVGFMKSLYSVRDFFVDLFVFVLSNLPVLLVIAIALLLFTIIRKKIQKNKPPKQRLRLRFRKKMHSKDDDEMLLK